MTPDHLNNIALGPQDISVSFDVVSLIMMVPVTETMEFIKELFPADITALFHHVLTTTYFLWNSQVYKELDGVAMGSPLSPFFADVYMERFEQAALRSASCQLLVWYRYVDDTFVVWSHGEEELGNLLQHLNTVKFSASVQFQFSASIFEYSLPWRKK